MSARVGIRPCRDDGSVDIDTVMVAAAIQSYGRTRYRWVVRKASLVVVEFLEREESAARDRWVAWCEVCGEGMAPTYDRPAPARCCEDRDMRASLLPPGWSWCGVVSLSIEQARERGYMDRDPEGFWTRHPIGCLFGKAIREGWRHFAPDALPVGVRVHYEDEPAPTPGRASPDVERQAQAAREGQMVRVLSEAGLVLRSWAQLHGDVFTVALAAVSEFDPPRTGPRGGKRPLTVEVYAPVGGHDNIDVFEALHGSRGWDVAIKASRSGKPAPLEDQAGDAAEDAPSGHPVPAVGPGTNHATEAGSQSDPRSAAPSGNVPEGSTTRAEGPTPAVLLPPSREVGEAPPLAPTNQGEAPAPTGAEETTKHGAAVDREDQGGAGRGAGPQGRGGPVGGRAPARTGGDAPGDGAPVGAGGDREHEVPGAGLSLGAPAGEPQASGGAPTLRSVGLTAEQVEGIALVVAEGRGRGETRDKPCPKAEDCEGCPACWDEPVTFHDAHGARAADALRARVEAAWSKAVTTADDENEVDTPCALCEEGIEGGDRFRESTTMPAFAHAGCVEEAASGRDPKDPGEDAPLWRHIDSALAAEETIKEGLHRHGLGVRPVPDERQPTGRREVFDAGTNQAIGSLRAEHSAQLVRLLDEAGSPRPARLTLKVGEWDAITVDLPTLPHEAARLAARDILADPVQAAQLHPLAREAIDRQARGVCQGCGHASTEADPCPDDCPMVDAGTERVVRGPAPALPAPAKARRHSWSLTRPAGETRTGMYCSRCGVRKGKAAPPCTGAPAGGGS